MNALASPSGHTLAFPEGGPLNIASLRPEMLATHLNTLDYNRAVSELPRDYKKKLIFGSIDCCERFAGLANKFRAFSHFLESFPNHRGKCYLVS